MTPGWIDSYVRPAAEHGMASILPYMTASWRERFTGLGIGEAPCFRGASVADVQSEHLGGDGIRSVVLVPTETVNAWPDRDLTTNFLGAANTYFAEEWLSKDERFRLAALVCGQDAVWSAEELRRLAGTERIVAAAIAPMHALLGEAYYRPLYEACVEAGLPLIVYPTGSESLYIGAPQPAAGAPLTHLERRVTLTQIAQAQVASLVFDGVFDRYPDLRVVFAGFGFSWLVALLWRMDMDWRRTRVETPWVKRPPSDYVREHIRFTTGPTDAPTDPEELSQLLEMVMADSTLIFGSAFAGPGTGDGRLALDGLPDELQARIAAGTAEELFR